VSLGDYGFLSVRGEDLSIYVSFVHFKLLMNNMQSASLMIRCGVAHRLGKRNPDGTTLLPREKQSSMRCYRNDSHVFMGGIAAILRTSHVSSWRIQSEDESSRAVALEYVHPPQEQQPRRNDWTDDYLTMKMPEYPSDDRNRDVYVFPIMPLNKVKVLTDTVQLNIYEPRYRLLFRLAKRSQSRLFGVCVRDLSNRDGKAMSNVGVVCEMTHYVPSDETNTVFVSSRVVGRFVMEDVVQWKPFVVSKCKMLWDVQDEGHLDQVLQLEESVWNDIVAVEDIANDLFHSSSGNRDDRAAQMSVEVRRFAPDDDARASVVGAAGSRPDMIEAAKAAGFMESCEESNAHLDKASVRDENAAAEFICSEAMRETIPVFERVEKFSFAVIRSLGLSEQELLESLLLTSTEARLSMGQSKIREGLHYLAARKSLKDAGLS
jgi:Lon protease-like protein